MIKLGKIVIKEKVYFEYYELPKPSYETLSTLIKCDADILLKQEIEKYEASKRLIEVSNENCHFLKKVKGIKWILFPHKDKYLKNWIMAKNNIPCKAEINGTAKIIELIK